MMSQSSKRELLAALRPRYSSSSKAEKQRILDELVATLTYHRKYAIQLLGRNPAKRPKVRRIRPRKYTIDVVLAIEKLWHVANCIAAKRLVPGLKALVEALERHGEMSLEPKTRELLLGISSS